MAATPSTRPGLHCFLSIFLYFFLYIYVTSAAINTLPWFPKEWSSPHGMLQPRFHTWIFYLAVTHNFGHNHSWCWAGIRCYGFCLWVPNEVRDFSLMPINPDWGISCIPKRDPAAPSWFDGKKLSGHCLTLNLTLPRLGLSVWHFGAILVSAHSGGTYLGQETLFSGMIFK